MALENQEETKPQSGRREEIIKFRIYNRCPEYVQDRKLKQTNKRWNKEPMKFLKSWCFEKVSITDKCLIKKLWKTYINEIINEQGDIITHTSRINKSLDIL